MPSNQFYLLTEGKILDSLNWVFSEYISHGFLWLLFGILIFTVVQYKTKSYGISGLMLIIYFSIISMVTINGKSLIFEGFQPFILLFIGILGVILFIRIFR